ncbi:hypothetical protein KJ762_05610 [bacterium]|nr:hypothetical protein [bacterium]MBU1066110.1 hypothetical protein [bacterium]MBU1633971.1 hypothetical protein [bacterium]MBU1875177.1 hypothetical protein [bacterium]
MIRLNLTNQPGLQFVDESEKFDLEGLEPDEVVEEQEGDIQADSDDGATAPVTSASVPNIKDIPDMPMKPRLARDVDEFQIDDDLFKLAEANLDLIEQAEEEEFGTSRKSKAAPEPEEKPEKKRNKHPLFRYGFLVGAIIVLFIVLWLYKNGQLSREKVREVALDASETVAEKVSEKATDVIRTADDLSEIYSDRAAEVASQIPGATRQLSSDVSEVTRQMSSGMSDARAQIASRIPEVQTSSRSVNRVYGSSDISTNLIQRVQVGQNKLNIAADVLAQFPTDSRLLYLRVKNDRLSFILYVSSEYVAEQVKNYFISQSRFLSPEVFFIERSNTITGNPVEIMAIVRFQSMSSNDTKGYKYLTDRQLSQYVWQASLKSSVRMNPLKISNNDITTVRDAEIIGNGITANVITMMRELAAQRHNMSTSMLSIRSNTSRPISESILDFDLNSVIYPGNM